MAEGTVTFEIDSCIHGYRAYGVIWTPTFSEHISCERPGDSQYGGPLPKQWQYPMLRGTVGVQLLRIPLRAAFPCLLSRRPF